MPEISGSTVVITGASSGIGRTTAKHLHDRGANVVLGARRAGALEDVVAELGAGRALAVPTDVTDADAVRALAAAAHDRFGRIDAWVNNASVIAYGAFEKMPPEEWRRIIETNLIGYANGARAALPHLRESKGALVNVGSVNSRASAPYCSPYVAAKFGVRGFTESLRQEMLQQGSGVDIGMILPASIDTQIFQTGANHFGRKPKALDPVNEVEDVAKAITKMIEKPKAEILVGRGARSLIAFHDLLPAIFERVLPDRLIDNQFLDEPAEDSAGNLFEPTSVAAAPDGGWQDGSGSGATAAKVAAAGAAIAVAAVAIPRVLRAR